MQTKRECLGVCSLPDTGCTRRHTTAHGCAPELVRSYPKMYRKGTPRDPGWFGTFLSVLYSFGTLRVLFDVFFDSFFYDAPRLLTRFAPLPPRARGSARAFSRLLNRMLTIDPRE